MKRSLPKSGKDKTERLTVRKDLIRRTAELAMIRGRQPDQPTREDLRQAEREVKPLDMSPQQERV
jgi:hypothetical protein